MSCPVYNTKEEVLALPWVKGKIKGTARGKGIACVYALVNRATKQIDYIGKTVHLRRRLMHHKVYDKDVHEVIYFPLADEAERGYAEYRFIDLFDPPLNIRAGQIHRNVVPLDAAESLYRSLFG